MRYRLIVALCWLLRHPTNPRIAEIGCLSHCPCWTLKKAIWDSTVRQGRFVPASPGVAVNPDAVAQRIEDALTRRGKRVPRG